ncbi:MAG TPA: hypothetical protein VFV07_12490, partial [Rhizomicrobium sp.]|nr:hypothetical protein [Rhizomicrobium sp.]
ADEAGELRIDLDGRDAAALDARGEAQGRHPCPGAQLQHMIARASRHGRRQHHRVEAGAETLAKLMDEDAPA